MRSNVKQYLSRASITKPAYMVTKIASWFIRARAKVYFRGKMLDIGCGDKSKGLLVGDCVDEHLGLDHEKCLHDTTGVDLMGTAYDIPLDDSSTDSVLCTAVLEHLEEPQKALDEAYRVLTSGGYAIYTAPFFWHLHEEPRDFYRYTEFGLRHLFEKSGFEIIEVTPMAGIFVTLGSEISYFLTLFSKGPFRPLIKGLIACLNVLFIGLNKMDVRYNPEFGRWTWMHIIVARKPECL